MGCRTSKLTRYPRRFPDRQLWLAADELDEKGIKGSVAVRLAAPVGGHEANSSFQSKLVDPIAPCDAHRLTERIHRARPSEQQIVH